MIFIDAKLSFRFRFQVHTIDAEDIRREKGTFTREKNRFVHTSVTRLDHFWKILLRNFHKKVHQTTGDV